jgi:hypothetical protein
MRSTSCCLWLLAASLALGAAARPARAGAFSSSCDRFEIDGNAFGPADGTADFVDEFTSGTLAPNWALLLGTVVQTGGALVASNPGTAVQLGPVPFEISTAENAIHEIGDGEGDFTMTSSWLPPLPATDTEFHMQLYSISPIIEAVGLTVTNLSPSTASLQGSPPGYAVNQSVTHGFGSGFSTLQSNSAPINPAAVTGRIVIRMSLDDTTNMVTTSFSLDGGATFQSPFPPMQIFNGGVTDYDILLGAAALGSSTGPTSTQTLPLDQLVVKSGSTQQSRRVTYKATFARGQGGLLLGNPVVAGAKFNLQVDAENQCFSMPAIGWIRDGRTYKYLDREGQHGPVKVAWLRQLSNGSIQNKVVVDGKRGPVDIVPPNPGIRGDANFNVGGSEYCASTAGGTIHPNTDRTFKATKAPAPASCYVPACSPSGAFLD